MHAALLKEFSTTGISLEGARIQKVLPGPPGSHRLALIDLERICWYEDPFLESAELYCVPAALLAGICSRETRCRNIIGDHGNGVGLMQIDKRYHPFATEKGAMTPDRNIEYAARLLASNWTALCRDMSKASWTYAEKLRGAVAAYNSGLRNVQTWERMDVGTTQNDYSADVWERARAFYPYFSEK